MMELHSGVCGMCSSKGLILDSRDSGKYFNILCSYFHDELNNICEVQEYYKDIELCPECTHHITLLDIKKEYFSSRDETENSESNDRCAFCVEDTNLLTIYDNSFLKNCKSWTNIETGITLCVSCYYLIHVRNTLKNNIILKVQKDDHTMRRKSKEKDHVPLNNGHQANIHSDMIIRPSTSKEAHSTPVSNKRKRNRTEIVESSHSFENNNSKKRKIEIPEMSEVYANDELTNFDMSNILGISPLCVSSFNVPNDCKIDKKMFNCIPFVKMRPSSETIAEIVQPNYICSLVSQRNMIRVRRTPPIKIKSIKNLMQMENKSKSIKKKQKSHSTEIFSQNKLVVRVERMKLPLQEKSTENTSICESEHTDEHVTPKKKKRVHFNDTPTIIITEDSYYDDIEVKNKGRRTRQNSQSIMVTDQEKLENVGAEEHPIDEQSDEEEPISLSIDIDSDDNTENAEQASENNEEDLENDEDEEEDTENVKTSSCEKNDEKHEEDAENNKDEEEDVENNKDEEEDAENNKDEEEDAENNKDEEEDTENMRTSSCENSDEKHEEDAQHNKDEEEDTENVKTSSCEQSDEKQEEDAENDQDEEKNTEKVKTSSSEKSDEKHEEDAENDQDEEKNTEKVKTSSSKKSDEKHEEHAENDKDEEKDTEKLKTSSCEKSDKKQEESKQCEEILDDVIQISENEEQEMENLEQTKHIEENLSEADKISHQQIKVHIHELSFVASGNIVEINTDSEEPSSNTNENDQVEDSKDSPNKNRNFIRENSDNLEDDQIQESTDLTNESEDSVSNNSDNQENDLNQAPTDIPKESEVETEKSDSSEKNISKGKDNDDDDDTVMNHVDEPNPKLNEEKGENQKIDNVIIEVEEDEKKDDNQEESNTTDVVEEEDADEIDSLDGFEVIDQDNDACEENKEVNVSKVTVESEEIDKLLKKYCAEDSERDTTKDIRGHEEGDVNKSKSLEPGKSSVDFGSLIDEVQKCLFTEKVQEAPIQVDDESAALSLLEILEDSFEEDNADEGVSKRKSTEGNDEKENT